MENEVESRRAKLSEACCKHRADPATAHQPKACAASEVESEVQSKKSGAKKRSEEVES